MPLSRISSWLGSAAGQFLNSRWSVLPWYLIGTLGMVLGLFAVITVTGPYGSAVVIGAFVLAVAAEWYRRENGTGNGGTI